MMEPQRIIELDNDLRELYTKYDYEFFLKRHFNDNDYSPENVALTISTYETTKKRLQKEIKSNKAQMLFHIDGRVRKMHSGGILPMRFELGEKRSGGIINFEGEGESWAYFDIWKHYERRKILRRRMWDIIIKTGALLGFGLTIIKITEVIF